MDAVRVVAQYDPVFGRWVGRSLMTRGAVGYELFKWATFHTAAGRAALWRAISRGTDFGAVPPWMAAEIRSPTSEWVAAILRDERPLLGVRPSPPFMRLDEPRFLCALMGNEPMHYVQEIVDARAIKTLISVLRAEVVAPGGVSAANLALMHACYIPDEAAGNLERVCAQYANCNEMCQAIRESSATKLTPPPMDRISWWYNREPPREMRPLIYEMLRVRDDPRICDLFLRSGEHPFAVLTYLIKLRHTACLRAEMKQLGPGVLAALEPKDVLPALELFPGQTELVVAAAANPDPRVCLDLMRLGNWTDFRVLILTAAFANTREWDRLWHRIHVPIAYCGNLARAVSSAAKQSEFDALCLEYPTLLNAEFLTCSEKKYSPSCATVRQHHLAHGALFENHAVLQMVLARGAIEVQNWAALVADVEDESLIRHRDAIERCWIHVRAVGLQPWVVARAVVKQNLEAAALLLEWNPALRRKMGCVLNQAVTYYRVTNSVLDFVWNNWDA